MITTARAFVIPVRATAQPKKKIKATDVKRAIEHAKLICFNFEDTKECRVAWDHVEEISAARHDQVIREAEEARRLEISQREYDM